MVMSTGDKETAWRVQHAFTQAGLPNGLTNVDVIPPRLARFRDSLDNRTWISDKSDTFAWQFRVSQFENQDDAEVLTYLPTHTHLIHLLHSPTHPPTHPSNTSPNIGPSTSSAPAANTTHAGQSNSVLLLRAPEVRSTNPPTDQPTHPPTDPPNRLGQG